LINVPSGVWIDETGRVARPPETAAPKDQELQVAGKVIRTQGTAYINALRDWIAKGNQSKFVLTDDDYKRRLKDRSPNEQQAEACFKLAVALHEKGQPELARKWWQQAQQLNPDSWNYHRQDWSFSPDAGKKWMEKFQRTTTDYYPALELKPKP